jgi:hypothetical protein
MILQRIRPIAGRIVQDLAINSGQPIIGGTRIFVDRIIEHLENGMSIGVRQRLMNGATSFFTISRRVNGIKNSESQSTSKEFWCHICYQLEDLRNYYAN